eukprot:gnl/MRDRNA2_/MRDRNA2_128401_c0_seq1.p1 gnl/MRDRNA2_/MRDRNA2_128401_c0~~gnl/MRDRNA2_/MRDRNA2_128401_c0_seq1.p1  ORF type:complete len:451 (-),score=49.69 gnl/MRDRNA2_/MRDRNA2_128401_c0_seq1:10-1362(-)
MQVLSIHSHDRSTRRRWYSGILPLFAACYVTCATGKVHLMGSPVDFPEFPQRYHKSARGFTRAILAERPAEVQSMQFPVLLEDPSRKMLKLNISMARVDFAKLKAEVYRIERHFRDIDGMTGSQQLKHFTTTSQCATGGHEGNCSEAFRLTTYSDYYNIFFIDSPAIGALYWAVKIMFHQYAKAYNLDLTTMYFIHSWFNCFRKGSAIKLHSHGPVISGNLAIHVPPGSFTHYLSLGESPMYTHIQLSSQDCLKGNQRACKTLKKKWFYKDQPENIEPSTCSRRGPDACTSEIEKGDRRYNHEGELVMFFGMLKHESSSVTEEMRQILETTGPTDCRMTAAFDIVIDPRGAGHVTPLYDPQDPWWELSPNANIGDRIGSAVEKVLEEQGVPAAYEWDTVPDKTTWAAQQKKIMNHPGNNALRAWIQNEMNTDWESSRVALSSADILKPEL